MLVESKQPRIVLYEPEIPQNTGNIIRLCANAGFALELIQPLGFSLADKYLRRSGLDYHDKSIVTVHKDWQGFLDCYNLATQNIVSLTTKSNNNFFDLTLSLNITLVFGPETRGLPAHIRNQFHTAKLPMQASSRSMNLSNCVAVCAYEVWRQALFAKGT